MLRRRLQAIARCIGSSTISQLDVVAGVELALLLLSNLAVLVDQSQGLLAIGWSSLSARAPANHLNYPFPEGELPWLLYTRLSDRFLRGVDLTLIILCLARLAAPGGPRVRLRHVLDLLILSGVRVVRCRHGRLSIVLIPRGRRRHNLLMWLQELLLLSAASRGGRLLVARPTIIDEEQLIVALRGEVVLLLVVPRRREQPKAALAAARRSTALLLAMMIIMVTP